MKKILFALAFLLAGLTAEQAPAQQLVKLCSGQPCTDVTSTNGLPTTPSAPAAGTYTGQVGGYDEQLLVVPTIQNASYVSGNAVGALQTVAIFRTTAQPSGIFDGLGLQWLGTEVTPITFYIFNKVPSGSTTCTDKAAFVLAAADAANLIMPPFALTAAAPTVGTTLTSAQSTFTPFSVKNKDSVATVDLYVCAVAGGTFTPAVGDLTYKLEMAQD
jgi:hypothetical protein